jgi:hypothetical protein
MIAPHRSSLSDASESNVELARDRGEPREDELELRDAKGDAQADTTAKTATRALDPALGPH